MVFQEKYASMSVSCFLQRNYKVFHKKLYKIYNICVRSFHVLHENKNNQNKKLKNIQYLKKIYFKKTSKIIKTKMKPLQRIIDFIFLDEGPPCDKYQKIGIRRCFGSTYGHQNLKTFERDML